METKKLCGDLMIGDWVYSTFSDKPCKVQAIELSEHGYGSVRVTGVDGVKDIVSLSPIPITAEMLEKNGFSELMEHDEWTCIFRKYIDELIIEVGNYEPMFINIGYLDSDGEEENLSSIVKVNGENFFFHDLQHALRLCGINDKEIVP